MHHMRAPTPYRGLPVPSSKSPALHRKPRFSLRLALAAAAKAARTRGSAGHLPFVSTPFQLSLASFGNPTRA
ncbi:uncharacterized protein K452DRAFT_283646 [Aplosporella prunicola CBS 121167]|uniref:Uncharacterized protein n=1 Tax=Aplosporella prunicola CBS 121167 TaxID=1176127 RepID=A0A6A6BT02_9PEZI|nr:uncharacterized protein K452DRAFT_283646 [Aplosporella prunicola CBS 121167]KAF2146374.1 hypothetical protein K452DRAFT_283646 [Aplosporella prunicola CBS 121167]